MPTWTWSGDRAILRAFPRGDLAAANASARTLARALIARPFPEVEDAVAGARTVLIVLQPGTEPGAGLLDMLEAEPDPSLSVHGHSHEIPVTYDGEDLTAVAEVHGLTTDDVIRLHSSAMYTVGFMGFSPGFAYLLGLPEALHTPRLDTPRTKVPAGSVAVGGGFTGVYPRATPGGWRLIGRTDVVLFDARNLPPSRLAPGEVVRFVPR